MLPLFVIHKDDVNHFQRGQAYSVRIRLSWIVLIGSLIFCGLILIGIPQTITALMGTHNESPDQEFVRKMVAEFREIDNADSVLYQSELLLRFLPRKDSFTYDVRSIEREASQLAFSDEILRTHVQLKRTSGSMMEGAVLAKKLGNLWLRSHDVLDGVFANNFHELKKNSMIFSSTLGFVWIVFTWACLNCFLQFMEEEQRGLRYVPDKFKPRGGANPRWITVSVGRLSDQFDIILKSAMFAIAIFILYLAYSWDWIY